MKKWFFGLFLLLAGSAVVVGISWQQLQQWVHQPWVQSDQIITIKKGQTAHQIYAQLSDQVHWSPPRELRAILFRIWPQLTQLQAGTYQLTAQQSFWQVSEQLQQGKVLAYKVSIPEGSTVKEWWQILSQQPHLVLTLSDPSAIHLAFQGDHPNAEGLFFPSTYFYQHQETDQSILKRAKVLQLQHLDRLWASRQPELPYRSAYEALIMSSIVEKETGSAPERPLIASVFTNRLRKKMRLQTDPTIIYGLGDAYQGNITRRHLRQKTPYNTYRIPRLPPTPIASSGLAALEAVLNPPSSDYLYFVSKGDGTHYFSTHLKEHNQAVRRYQLRK